MPPVSRPETRRALDVLFLVVLFAATVLLLTGCTATGIEADAARFRAVKPLVAEHVQTYPAEAQSWADFMRAWELSLQKGGVQP